MIKPRSSRERGRNIGPWNGPLKQARWCRQCCYYICNNAPSIHRSLTLHKSRSMPTFIIYLYLYTWSLLVSLDRYSQSAFFLPCQSYSPIQSVSPSLERFIGQVRWVNLTVKVHLRLLLFLYACLNLRLPKVCSYCKSSLYCLDILIDISQLKQFPSVVTNPLIHVNALLQTVGIFGLGRAGL